MTEIYNFFINTKNKDKDSSLYNYNYKLGLNFDFENQDAYFKIINFSMMNSMLNVSSYHNNNKFQINTITITIPDGNYNTTTLKDTINGLLTLLPVSLNYDSYLNKYYLNCSQAITFKPLNMKHLMGWDNDTYNIDIGITYADKFVNLLSYTKIIITTNNLTFEPTTENNLNSEYLSNESISEIIAYINKDIPTFATIYYENINNLEYKLSNKNLNYINIGLMNEYKEYIKDCPNCFIHFQIILRKKRKNKNKKNLLLN